MIDWDKWKEEKKIQKELLEEILQDFEKYDVTDPKAKAIISGKLQATYDFLGENK